MRRCLAAGLVATLIVLVAPASASADARDEAARFAGTLSSASSDAEAAAAIKAILARLKVRVLPNNYAGDPVGVYDFEIALAAEAFRKGELTSTDDVAAMLENGGLKFAGPQLGAGAQRPSGSAIEQALRNLRQRVETEKEEPNAFFILLIDELGKRKEHPFDLLGKPEDLCPDQARGLTASQKAELPTTEIYAAAAGDQADKMLNAGIAKAEAKGDDRTAEIMRRLQSSGAIQGMMRSPPTGGAAAAGAAGSGVPGIAGMPPGLAEAMRPLLDQKAREAGFSSYEDMMNKVASARAGSAAIRSAPAGADDPQRDLAAAMEKMRQDQASGADPRTVGKDAENVYRERRDLQQKLENRLRVEGAAALAEALEREKDSGADEAFKDVGLPALGNWIAQEKARSAYERADIEYRVVRTQQEVIRDEDTRARSLKAGIPIPKATSCLYLDPVQLLLVCENLLGLDKEVRK